MEIIIIKSNGTHTSKMAQAQVESYLGSNKRGGGFLTPDLIPTLKQALNDVTTPTKGKSTADYTFNGNPVLHASSGPIGVAGQSISIFFYRSNNVNYIFAMGKHVSSDEYKLAYYGQPTKPFRENDTVYASLKAKEHAERVAAELVRKAQNK